MNVNFDNQHLYNLAFLHPVSADDADIFSELESHLPPLESFKSATHIETALLFGHLRGDGNDIDTLSEPSRGIPQDPQDLATPALTPHVSSGPPSGGNSAATSDDEATTTQPNRKKRKDREIPVPAETPTIKERKVTSNTSTKKSMDPREKNRIFAQQTRNRNKQELEELQADRAAFRSLDTYVCTLVNTHPEAFPNTSILSVCHTVPPEQRIAGIFELLLNERLRDIGLMRSAAERIEQLHGEHARLRQLFEAHVGIHPGVLENFQASAPAETNHENV